MDTVRLSRLYSKRFIRHGPILVNIKRHYYAKHLRASKMFPGLVASPLTKEDKKSDKESPEPLCKSQQLMLQMALIQGAAAGTFYTLPLLTRSLEKLKRIIDETMQSIGAQKVTTPCLAPGSIWKASDRWNVMGSELLKLKDRQNKDMCLSPTHEEAITSIVGKDASVSHNKLPIKYYQIGRKFRDEMRPKNGLLRGREFEMKDLYTFDASIEAAEVCYNEVCDAYSEMFRKLNLDVLKVQADSGAMGGNKSHEYHLISEVGEDTLLQCSKCGTGVSKELADKQADSKKCMQEGCPGDWREITGIEIGHTFLLGTKYSKIFKARAIDSDNKLVDMQMGCYGIGVSRLLAAAVEVLSTQESIRWPQLLAPHQVCIISQQTGYFFEESLAIAETLQEELLSKPNLYNEVILDDRHRFSIGKRKNICERFGFPYIIIVGKKIQEEVPKFEFHDVYSGAKQFLTKEQIFEELSHVNTIMI